jgi:hypothetical protein
MKTQKRSLGVFLLMFFVICTYLSPSILAQEGNGYQYMGGQGNTSGIPPQGPSDTTNHTSAYGGNPGGGYQQNNSGQQGSNDYTSSQGHQYRHRYQHRYTVMEGANNFTRIRSLCQENTSNEAFEILFTIDTTPLLQLSYLQNINASSIQHQFSLIVEQLIEFSDVNGDGKYDPNDVVLSSLNMSNSTFTNITYTNSTASDGTAITIMETHTSDGMFSIQIYLVSGRTMYLNNTITSKEIKIDFAITDYPFVNQTSQLALITQMETPFIVAPEQETYDEQQGTAIQESGLNISSTTHSGFFTWANEASVDDVIQPISVTVLSETEETFTGNAQETSTSTQVIFSYPHGERILHDPKIGIVNILQTIIPTVLPLEYLSLIYLFACIISGIIFLGVIRYRKK